MINRWPVLVVLLAAWCAGIGSVLAAVHSRGSLLVYFREARRQGWRALRRVDVALVAGGGGLLSAVVLAAFVVTAVKLILRYLE